MAELLNESMTRIHFSTLTVRCWRQEEIIDDITRSKTRKEIIDKLSDMNWEPNMYKIGKVLVCMDRMNAVEVLDSISLDGIVIYKDWP